MSTLNRIDTTITERSYTLEVTQKRIAALLDEKQTLEEQLHTCLETVAREEALAAKCERTIADYIDYLFDSGIDITEYCESPRDRAIDNY